MIEDSDHKHYNNELHSGKRGGMHTKGMQAGADPGFLIGGGANIQIC